MRDPLWLAHALERIARMPHKTLAQRKARSEVLRRAAFVDQIARNEEATRGTEAS